MGILSRRKRNGRASDSCPESVYSSETLGNLLIEGKLEEALDIFLDKRYTPKRVGDGYYTTLDSLVKGLNKLNPKKRSKIFYEINKMLYREFFGKKLLAGEIEPLDGRDFDKELKKALKSNKDIVYRAVENKRKGKRVDYAGGIKKFAEYLSKIWDMQEEAVDKIKARPNKGVMNLEAAMWQEVGAHFLRETGIYDPNTGEVKLKDKRKALEMIHEITFYMSWYGMETAIAWHLMRKRCEDFKVSEDNVIASFPMARYLKKTLPEEPKTYGDLKEFLESSPLGKMMVLKSEIGVDEKVVDFIKYGGEKGEMYEIGTKDDPGTGWTWTKEDSKRYREKERLFKRARELEKKWEEGTLTPEEEKELTEIDKRILELIE